jgi:hypothetical protein
MNGLEGIPPTYSKKRKKKCINQEFQEQIKKNLSKLKKRD